MYVFVPSSLHGLDPRDKRSIDDDDSGKLGDAIKRMHRDDVLYIAEEDCYDTLKRIPETTKGHLEIVQCQSVGND